ncbi:zinc ABC transporter substrate-binding protein ZnuA [Serratia odorifera]|uniref:High-affinity zinc uptake system protein ZnuA n=2 Tax=Serratia odorifera TaxID=618 RepID=D4E5I1_SEROD|nr:zinc ABC transporter substrate-binding protein ZnuA [Serratia odorifera]EFE94997.1 putative high-affinity zinc transporter periplasmic component [Serratia odorifera DSM 4582]MBJ2064287.1 zinc ABC transporter substrate-binding protein ZnuA [Serratia odorifera]PNK89707.1 zinc ABC transporter substrate-binding protein [Serratia odorifera]RII70709.1 zinc ABC transporter substrate-binding protein ZnuA [Serratia odorifera]VDZ62399.1 High-affinity zinc uptake system protein znuA precursor [Serrati
MTQKNKWLQRTLLASALMMAGSAYAAVVTTVRPLGFIASEIADGVTDTEILLPDGASPHDFALRPSDLQRLRAADLVVWVGPDMEAFLSKALQPVAANKQIAIAELPAVKPLLLKGEDHHDHAQETHNHAAHDHADEHGDDQHHHDHGEYNMHVWLSPEIAKVTAIAIHDRLLELMPQNKDKLDANLRRFEDQLAQTDKNVVKMLTPVQGKGYFVFHDAYGYFEKHFGLSPLGHFTVNPEIQPGAQRLHQIRTQLVEQKAECVFAEPQFRPAVITAVAKGTKVRSGTLDPLGSGIALGKGSYGNFLTALSNQYVSCLK